VSRPLPSRRWLQFRLRSLLLLVLVVSVGLGGWQYWRQTRHMWRLQWAIREYVPHDSEEARLLRQLAWDPEAWDSGLLDAIDARVRGTTKFERDLFWYEGKARLKWFTQYTEADGSTHRVYLYKPLSCDRWHPLTCLVTDGERRFEMWQTVAERNSGFEFAAVEKGTPPILRIHARRWFPGSIRYDYEIKDETLCLVKETETPEYPPAYRAIITAIRNSINQGR